MSINLLITGLAIVESPEARIINIGAYTAPTVFQQLLNGCKRLKNITFTGVFNISTAITQPSN